MRSLMVMNKIIMALAFTGLVIACASDFAEAQAKKADKEQVKKSTSSNGLPSDKVAKVFGTIAFSMVPDKYKNKKGELVEIDKSDPSKISIPIEDAKRVIKDARMSAHAQICDLADHQAANYLSMMRREQLSGKWSKFQMLYINRLHLFTVQYLTGNAKIVESDKDDKKGAEPAKNTTELKKTKLSCSDEDRERVKQRIEAFVREIQDKKS